MGEENNYSDCRYSFGSLGLDNAGYTKILIHFLSGARLNTFSREFLLYIGIYFQIAYK